MVIQVLSATRIYRSADDGLSPTSRPVLEISSRPQPFSLWWPLASRLHLVQVPLGAHHTRTPTI